MSALLTLLAIMGALVVGIVSPGPSFVLVSRIAAKASRRDGLAAALGMALGGGIFATLAVLGLAAVILQVKSLYLLLRVAGGLYLIYLGIRIWRGAGEPLKLSDPGTVAAPSPSRSFAIGLFTQLSNPKTAIIYASVFAALMPGSAPFWLFLSLPLLAFVLEGGWYAVVALAFSASGPRSVYLRAKRWIDRAAGAVMGALGARLVSDGLSRS